LKEENKPYLRTTMKRKQSFNIKTLYIILSGIILCLILLHLYIYTKNITIKYEVANLKIKQKELKSKNRILKSNFASEKSLQKIEKTAKEELNMDYPKDVHYIILKGEEK